MIKCPKCGTEHEDGLKFCTQCGAPLDGSTPQAPVVAPDPTDHTAEFDAKDISDNKVVAMCVYLLGVVGILIALLAASTSKYAAFHVRNALKIVVVENLLLICAAVLFFTVIVPIAAFICFGILYVVNIICFFQVCQGKAKEVPIIKGLKFLK